MKRRILYFLNLLRNRWAAFLHDLAWIPLAIWLSFQLRFNFQLPPGFPNLIEEMILIAVLPQSFFFWFFGLYRGIWRFASLPDLIRIMKAVALGTLTVTALFFAFTLPGVPRSLLLLYPVLLAMGLSGPRLFYRWLRDRNINLSQTPSKRALVLGAGLEGEELARSLVSHRDYDPVAFLDDNPSQTGAEIRGIRVAGTLQELEGTIRRFGVEVVFLALPHAPRDVVHQVVTVCSQAKVSLRILPTSREGSDGKVEVSRLRPLTVEDLLGREPVSLDDRAIGAFLQGKRVLVTGGGGSIGSELCRQVSALAPARLTVLERSEHNLYLIEQELRPRHPELDLQFLLGDVTDTIAMARLMEQERFQVVFHSAAYKHVPLVEANPVPGVYNNVHGTRVMADLAHACGCERFILISTDKAINPSSIMGASKRVAEVYCQNFNARSHTRYITVRFGNVLNSAGSVVPLFQKQIAGGGPVTVTHPEVSRYFMTIPEAVGLVLQAGAMGDGGEIFVLDMGKPVLVLDLARQMIRLSGLEPDRDIPIQFIGLRPGEKMSEELFHAKEALRGTHHPKILLANSRTVDWGWLEGEMDTLDYLAREGDAPGMMARVVGLVPEYQGPPPPLPPPQERPLLRVVGEG